MKLTEDQRAAIESGIAALKQCGWTHRVLDLMCMLKDSESAAPAQSEEPVYQTRTHGMTAGYWMDSSKEIYDACAGENYERRIVYAPPQPSPTAVVLDERAAISAEQNEALRLLEFELAAQGKRSLSNAVYMARTRAVSPQPVEQTQALTDQQIYDKFSFLEGLVSESTYRKIADKAIEIARAARPASGETDE